MLISRYHESCLYCHLTWATFTWALKVENLYDEEKKGNPTAAKGGEWEAGQQNVKLIEGGEGGNGGYGVES